MSKSRLGEAFNGLAPLENSMCAKHLSPASAQGSNPPNPSSRVHGAIVRRSAADNHVQVIP